MNFNNTARKFLSLTNVVEISSDAQCMYFQILNIYNSKYWPEEPIEIENGLMHKRTGLSRHQILDARNELQSLGLIYYQKGSGSRGGKYTLINIENAKLDSIVELTKVNEVKIDNLAELKKQLDNMPGDFKVYGYQVLSVLNHAIENNASGVYGNYYTTSQMFLKSSDTLKLEVIEKCIKCLKYKADIQNPESYILSIIANEVKTELKKQNKAQVTI